MAFAQGGHKHCVQAFGADQFDEEDERESVAQSLFLNWWYFSMTGGILVALLVLPYIQENLNWELGFGIPCILMCFAVVIFLLGSKSYRFRVNGDQRNLFLRIGLVFVNELRNWRASPGAVYTAPESQQWEHHQGAKLEFLDKALLACNGCECDERDVEDAKVVLRFVPIWCACLGYAIVVSQGSDTVHQTRCDNGPLHCRWFSDPSCFVADPCWLIHHHPCSRI